MKPFSIKNETEDLVAKTESYLKEITPDVALDIFCIIKDEFYDEYKKLCREKSQRITNQWIGKAIPFVYNLKHNNEHVRVSEKGHLIKSYTVFYQ